MATDPDRPDRRGTDGESDAENLPDRGARSFAVDPTRNVVLEASAGTGKTSILVTRYINLLRAGVDPANIVAITFTRKAAAEMRERIVHELRVASTRSPADRARWQGLRDRSGDIAISTIDAFCLSLLREFPIEAGLDPGFDVADEAEILNVTEDALDRALRASRGLATRDEDVRLAFAQLGERRLRIALGSLLRRRLVTAKALARFLAAAPASLTFDGAAARASARLAAALGALPGGRDAFLKDGPTLSPRFRLLASDLRDLEGRDAADVRAILDRLEQHVFTQAGSPRRQLGPMYRLADCASEAAGRRHLAALSSLAPGVRDVITTFDRDCNVLLARGLRRMFLVARSEYARALEGRAVVDFTEVLARTLRLLGRMDEFSQSRYRLEARYHHVLVDEFQDTNRAQWRLVASLIGAWGEGAGLAHDAGLAPSIFVVGDRKQSIYAFRDAEVRVFRAARRRIEGLRETRDVQRALSHSFRAVPGLLAFTNDLFDEVEKDPRRDDAFRFGASDRFPVSGGSGAAGGMTEPVVGVIVADRPQAAAEAVAAEVERLLSGHAVRDPRSGVRRTAEPGDIAILFRARASHREVEQALAFRNIPTYVYKGLGFFDASETKDVVALLRYLASPWSDLRAAAFLRSRFVRLSDGALRALAPRLAEALLQAEPPPAAAELDGEDRRVLSVARAAAGAWVPLVDRVPPAALIDGILGDTAYAFELRGARLAQARENLKKLRALVRRIQNRGYATLERIAGVFDRLSTGDESNAVVDAVGAVNLMTVHAAKGLEFPIVFVVNLERGTGGMPDPVLVTFEGWHRVPVVSVGGMLDEAAAVVRGRDREETKRLLYVAVTRARDRLYLSASLKDGRLHAGPGSLAEVVPESMRALLAAAASAGSGADLDWPPDAERRHAVRVSLPPQAPAGPEPQRVPAVRGEVSDDFGVLADGGTVSRAAVSTIAAQAGGAPAGSVPDGVTPAEAPAAGSDLAALTGTLVHRLFQLEAAGAGGSSVGEAAERARHLTRDEELAGIEHPERLFETAAEAYLAIRERPDVRALLGSGECLFEVPFSAVMEAGTLLPARMVVRGAIDCLVLAPERRVVVVDFKTGAPRPEHRAQVDLYVDAARNLLPGAVVEGLLVYPPSS